MSELSAAEVCTAGNGGARKFQAWRTLMSWFSFVFQIFWQVVKGTPPFAQVLSFLGGGHPLLSSSPAFKLLPVDSRTDALPTVREADTVAVGRLKDELYKVNEEFQNLKEQLQRLHHSVTSGEGIVQADDKSVNDNFVANDPIDNERREKVKEAMIHAWNSYDKYAWGQDELQVVLDLDETLVCAYETSTLHPVIRKHATEAGLDCFELECFSGEKDIDGRQKVNHVTVFERPGLRDFLQQISEFADLILFTAGLEGYARPLVDHIDVDNKFCRRLYRPATVSTEYREHVKDLFIISKNLCRIVIVDNNPFSFLLQPLNGIPCVPFSAGQPNDEQLLGVILPLLKKLSSQKDVRPLLEERFRMPEWFKHHGIPIVDAN